MRKSFLIVALIVLAFAGAIGWHFSHPSAMLPATSKEQLARDRAAIDGQIRSVRTQMAKKREPRMPPPLSGEQIKPKAPDAVRLAIVPESTLAAFEADWLTWEFSKNPRVQLLERAEIDKVYQEQGLSAGGQDYLKLGQVLGADGLLLLAVTQANGKDLLNARLVAVKPGVVLAAGEFPLSRADLSEWSKAYAEHLGGYLPKLAVLAKDAVPISVINMRSAVSYGEAGETEQVLKSLTIERLSREPSLFVLERQRMELLSEEMARQGMDDSPFWNGSYLFEGTIDRDGYNPERMTLNVRLTPARGGAAVELAVAGSRTNVVGLVEELTVKVREALKLKASGEAWNAADEADQYFKEAQWAYRWGATKEAQNAAESALALGKRTRELALLRIQAYANEVPFHGGGNIYAPVYPDPAQLPVVSHLLALYCQDLPLLFTNAEVTDPAALLTGMQVFHRAVPLLDGLYHSAEMRAHHEAELSELRGLTRRVWGILEARRPHLSPDEFSVSWGSAHSSSLLESYREARRGLEMYDLVKWEEGGVIFERPEDSLELFKGMLLSGYVATEPPRIIGWTWEDRKRVPRVQQEFIEQLSASTNVALRLGGLCLALVHRGYFPKSEFVSYEQCLLGALWDNRDWVFSRPDHAMILEKIKLILNDHRAEAEVVQPLNDLQGELWRAYWLAGQTNFDTRILDALSPGWANLTSTNEAREILLSLNDVTNQPPSLKRAMNLLRARAGVPNPGQLPTVEVSIPAAKPIPVEFSVWSGNVFRNGGKFPPNIGRTTILRGDRLWLRLNYQERGDLRENPIPRNFVSVDLTTGLSKAVPFPTELGVPNEGFEVTEDALYVSAQDHLECFQIGKKEWKRIAVPMTEGAEITEFDGRLYLSTDDCLFQVDPASGMVQTIASKRRQPVLNDLDSIPAWGRTGFFRADHKLGLCIGGQLRFFDPVNQSWPIAAEVPGLNGSAWYRSDMGLSYIVNYLPRGHQLKGLWYDTNAPELLLEWPMSTPFQPHWKGVPRWEWPPVLDFAPSAVLAMDGKELWVLARSSPPWPPHSKDAEPRFQDDRNATLFHFDSNSSQAYSLPIRFVKEAQPVDLFSLTDHSSLTTFNPRRPVMLVTPTSIVVSYHSLMGHWLLKKSDVEKQMTPFQFILSTNQPAGGAPAATKGGL